MYRNVIVITVITTEFLQVSVSPPTSSMQCLGWHCEHLHVGLVG